MGRRLRILYAGAVYHVMNRGALIHQDFSIFGAGPNFLQSAGHSGLVEIMHIRGAVLAVARR